MFAAIHEDSMGKRKRTVVAALKSELSEYEALIHALRTADDNDISANLIRVSSVSARAKRPSPPDPDPGVSTLPASNSSPPPTRASLSKPKPSKPRGRTSKEWDRWPLHPADVAVSEWSFKDEVQLLASKFMRDFERKQAVDDGVEEDCVEDQPLLPGIYERTTALLEDLLAHIAEHVPLTSKSLQDRLHPLGWESILQIVSASRIVDDRIVANVLERMQAIYGPSETNVLHRLRVAARARRHLLDFVPDRDESSQISPTPPPSGSNSTS